MFIIELIYKAPLDEIDAHMRAHVKFLNKYSLRSLPRLGAQDPRDGGIILAVGESRDQIEAIVREDPFLRAAWPMFA
jgi:uncharacterized protein YciI